MPSSSLDNPRKIDQRNVFFFQFGIVCVDKTTLELSGSNFMFVKKHMGNLLVMGTASKFLLTIVMKDLVRSFEFQIRDSVI